MRTLDETIKGLAICSSTNDCEHPELGKCPYRRMIDSCIMEMHTDALQYLEEFRAVTDILHLHGIGSVWGITLPNPERTESKPDVDGIRKELR